MHLYSLVLVHLGRHFNNDWFRFSCWQCAFYKFSYLLI